MDSIGMLFVVLAVGILIGIAGFYFLNKKESGTVATDPKLQAYMDNVHSKLQAQVDELKTKLLPTDTQEKLKDVGDGLWETFKAKILAELAELRNYGLDHVANIDAMTQRVETFTKEELVKLHLEKEEVQPAVTDPELVKVVDVPVLTASPATPQTVVSSAPAVPVDNEQNKTV